ncbi:hypothetical protein GMDG_08176 [Pseudogymnoascus destructans 20631-21]|uniref:Uncharacterized protein n=1 Tax=Pseudogymnoascus destructans (strain ATCC MYA-4855 / 20631-21) TaxID=658429 RepID=L8G1C4_PSED2|nr:hypothetical protein GMDG_08176 [Pseudogymnoascus destructans 20631-21]
MEEGDDIVVLAAIAAAIHYRRYQQQRKEQRRRTAFEYKQFDFDLDSWGLPAMRFADSFLSSASRKSNGGMQFAPHLRQPSASSLQGSHILAGGLLALSFSDAPQAGCLQSSMTWYSSFGFRGLPLLLRHKEEGRGSGGSWMAPFMGFAIRKTTYGSVPYTLAILDSMVRSGKLSWDQTALSGLLWVHGLDP